MNVQVACASVVLFGVLSSVSAFAAAPTVVTSSASMVTGNAAQLNGSANPNGAETTGWFRYATASPGTCNDVFGTKVPAIGGSSLGSGNSPVPYSEGITGLNPGTPYYYCAIAQNTVGLSFGSVVSFTTPTAPTVSTSSASSITNVAARLNGAATPNSASTTGYFRYGPSNPGTCNDLFGTRVPASGGSVLGSGSSPVSFDEEVADLASGTTYHFCAIADNAEGTGFGAVLSFTTASAPSVATSAATNVTASSASFRGTAIPNGSSTYGYFRYGTIDPGTCSDAFGTREPISSGSDASLGSGYSPVDYSRSVGNLAAGTTYSTCAAARNSYGTSFGSVLTFTTDDAAPTVVTSSASMVTGSTAQVNGSANPNGAETTGWFRYATASPGTCNDVFGTKVPAIGGSSLGSGNSPVPYSEGITGLSQETPYYYCAIAQNTVGLSFGSVVSFTTPLSPAVVLNEFLVDPDSGLGDANNDGAVSSTQDQFVEIYNANGSDLDVSGWTIADADGVRHTFPAGSIIGVDCCAVVFGGGSPLGAFGGGLVQTASTGMLGLGIGGDTITLLENGVSIVATTTYGAEAGNDQSRTLDPDLVGLAYVDHGAATDSGGALFSPGTMVDGTLFSGCDLPPGVAITAPVDGAVDVAVDASILVAFTEDVTLISWYGISCATSGTHTAAVTGGPLTYTLIPDAEFAQGEVCSVTIFAEGVSDNDANDPPDAMVADHVFSFTTVGLLPTIIFEDGFESGDTDAWSSTAKQWTAREDGEGRIALRLELATGARGHALLEGDSISGDQVLRVELDVRRGVLRAVVAAALDSGSWTASEPVELAIDGASLAIEWERASAAGVTNGEVLFLVDGVQVVQLDQLDNANQNIHRFTLSGPLSRHTRGFPGSSPWPALVAGSD